MNCPCTPAFVDPRCTHHGAHEYHGKPDEFKFDPEARAMRFYLDDGRRLRPDEYADHIGIPRDQFNVCSTNFPVEGMPSHNNESEKQ